MEKYTSGIMPLVDYVEHAKDHEISEVPEHTDRLYILTNVLSENALLPHIKYASIDGDLESYRIVTAVAEEVFGGITHEEIEKVLEYYTKVHVRLERLNEQDIKPGAKVGSILDAAIIQSFVDIHGPSDEGRPITVDHTAAFIADLHDTILEWEKVVGNAEQYRTEFCHDLQRLVEADLIDETMVEQLEYLARTVTITTIRPLDYLCSDIDAVNATEGSNAHYRTDTHSMNVNIVSGLREDISGKEARAQMKHIVYHELVHSITLPWSQGDGAGGFRREWFLPKFITEAAAERLTTVMLDDKSARRIDKMMAKECVSMREVYGDYPRVFLPESQQYESAAYPEYRYLLDMMMAKLDWEAAGIDQAQAEKLLSRALLDGPSKICDIDRTCPHWRAFHQALTAASFPGFLVHLRDIFEYEGEEQILLNYFDSPGFDPHDKDSLPRTLTTKQYDWDNYRDTSLCDHAPDTAMLIGYASLRFSHYYGWREFNLLADKDDEDGLPNTDRQYPTTHIPSRFPDLKAANRRWMDQRNLARSEMLRQHYFAEKQAGADS